MELHIENKSYPYFLSYPHSTSESWNVYAFDDARKSAINQTLYLNAAQAYRNTIMNDADKGATMQFITRSYSSGVVGKAYIGVLRRKTNSVGFSSIYRDSGFLLTLSHEIGQDVTLEVVLLGAQVAQLLHRRRPQEHVRVQLLLDGAGLRALHGVAPGELGLDGLVAGAHVRGEAQVALGVLVPGEDLRRGGQRAEALHVGEHLGAGTCGGEGHVIYIVEVYKHYMD